MLKPRAAGLTLIEMLIAMTVVAAVFAFGMPNFVTWRQSVQIRHTAESFEAGLQLARAEAVRRNAPVRFQLTTTLDNSCALTTTGANWVVSVDAVAGSCGATPSPDTAPRIVQTRSNAGESSADAAVAGSHNAVVFNGLGRITNVASGTITFDVSNPAGGNCAASGGPMRCLRVAVTAPLGQIRMCDPARSTPDPQAC